MDPNAALKELCELTRKWQDSGLSDGPSDAEYDLARVAELFEGLDVWIRGGGFLPIAWEPKL